MSLYDHLQPQPADALLGLMAAYRADPRSDKIDLGVGVYRDDEGRTAIMQAVRAAESILVESSATKVYEGPRGNIEFCDVIEKFVLGDAIASDNATSLATPGGCGALFLALGLIKRLKSDATCWVSDPTWPNHLHIAETAGLKTAAYPYAKHADPSVDVDAMLATLNKATRGDVVIIQGPCHNPTGIDLSTEDWHRVGIFMTEHGLIPLVDIAYHGFATSLSKDLEGVQEMLKRAPDALLSYSCSKNFGMYRDRVGALIATSDNPKSLVAVQTHLADIARAGYSMPPAHGPAVVATIMKDVTLYAQWTEELSMMQKRMASLRQQMATLLQPRSNSYDPAALIRQNGMFSQLPFIAGGIDALREQGIYIPGNGRINIAGISPADIPRAAETMSAYL